MNRRLAYGVVHRAGVKNVRNGSIAMYVLLIHESA